MTAPRRPRPLQRTRAAQRCAIRPRRDGRLGRHGSGRARRDETLRTPAACFRSSSATTPATRPRWSRRRAGSRRRCSLQVAETICANSGPRPHERVRLRGRLDPAHGRRRSTSARPAILQLLLGNIGRPGGGIMAMRGHARIQGSSDIPTLYDLLPGYLPMPHAHEHENLQDTSRRTRPRRATGEHARLHGQPAEGLVGRGGHGGERILLRLPAAHHRRPLAPTTRSWPSWRASARATS